jgi:glycosyltransferase involved in cell wall biosynthesis
MRILFAVPYVPSRVRVRPFELIRALGRLGHAVHVVALRPPEDRWASDALLREACAQLEVFALSRAQTIANAARALAGSQPLQAAYSNHAGARARLRSLVASGEFDVLHVEHLRGVTLARGLRGIPLVFDAVDSIAHLFEQTAASAAGWRPRLMARLDLNRTRRFEARTPFLFERTLVTSPVDLEAFVRRAGPGARPRMAVLPNGVDWEFFGCRRSASDPATIIFSGKMSYHANAAAALHLARRVMPEVWKGWPDARLIIAGKDPSDELMALAADPRIEVTGYVEDLRPLFGRATVAVAPMLYGAGIQNKILEAMASGVPVVASPQACGGVTAEAGRDLLVGSTPAELAGHILRLLENPDMRNRLTTAAWEYVRREHDWTAIGGRLIAAYQEARRDYAGRFEDTTSR